MLLAGKSEFRRTLMIWNYCFWAVGAWNLFVLLLYGADKWKAKHGRWRISEAALLGTAFCMGGAGALLGMLLFRHKTRKWKFRILVPLFLLIQGAVVYQIFAR